jgi:hypothetical protein
LDPRTHEAHVCLPQAIDGLVDLRVEGGFPFGDLASSRAGLAVDKRIARRRRVKSITRTRGGSLTRRAGFGVATPSDYACHDERLPRAKLSEPWLTPAEFLSVAHSLWMRRPVASEVRGGALRGGVPAAPQARSSANSVQSGRDSGLAWRSFSRAFRPRNVVA